MKICLLTDPKPSPVLASTLSLLAARHTVIDRDPRTLTGDAEELPSELADVDLYLLKSRAAGARSFARAAERRGAVVVNSPSATADALDRVTTATLLRRASVPVPQAWTADSLLQFVDAARCATVRPAPSWPLVVKSRYSRRGDLVTLVSDLGELISLLPDWATEPVIVQQFIPNDGYDLKFWVIDKQLTVARRPAALRERTTDQDVAIDPSALPERWLSSVLDAGAALDLDIFGVDVVLTADGPVIIDVNPFPGFRSAAGADVALAELVERRISERGECA